MMMVGVVEEVGPEAVYTHLDRLEREIAIPARIPLLRVSDNDIHRDALDPHFQTPRH
ncbi:hypothetical protein ACIRRA_43490 [Nocardia sp. NPDC101769]|uniref:hypothetical protein n=1 Tax=Nocardia sp. NPDC101769 TaxID=3364333 RepID=UPI00382523A0